ncbi:hypothetical protein QBC40DRAFT_342561 [Triangularia verruculosa]|uniref:Uncharacterized protein n=1 Tax=Triangularia verruculosa TaxID=2587418 RepID=A0AAN6XA24_9PEZI|nr:hypothetical protein QBC40DRAFT_342561 [Triangularia verruculosa]
MPQWLRKHLKRPLTQRDCTLAVNIPSPDDTPNTDTLLFYKNLYHRLHHLEDYPNAASEARCLLISLLSEALLERRSGASVPDSTDEPSTLASIIDIQQRKTSLEWEDCVQKRRMGGPRQMFRNRTAAVEWLKQMAPLKYVDGAWLGHINRITTPFLFSSVVKNAWQVLSEEYGDGDENKHHAHIYHKLMQDLAPNLPSPDELAFTESGQGMDDPSVWRAAVGQLVISLFPHDFLPEILGYNVHFESIKLETLIVARELRELGIDPYYFNLHVSIDNAHSGHTAMALHAAQQYLEVVGSNFGADRKRQACRRLYAGFALSEYLEQPIHNAPIPDKLTHVEERTSAGKIDVGAEERVADILSVKVARSSKIHCASRIRLGGRALSEWLDPSFLAASEERATELVRHLAAADSWVRRGNSGESRFVRELLWGGRMFGAFTSAEVAAVRAWIDSMNEEDISTDSTSNYYWTFTTRAAGSIDEAFAPDHVMGRYAAFEPSEAKTLASLLAPQMGTSVINSSGRGVPDLWRRQQQGGYFEPRCPRTSTLGVAVSDTVCLPALFPLWFTHPCLLQPLISVPFRAKSPARAAVLRLMRAQAGFSTQEITVAGMDDVLRDNTVGVVELGIEMVAAALAAEPDPAWKGLPRSPAEVLERWPSETAAIMLSLTTSPNRNAGSLIGLHWAFIDLHDVMCSSAAHHGLLSQASCDLLSAITKRERVCLVECIDHLKEDGSMMKDIHESYGWGVQVLRDIFV